jgi:hypothetical protein
MFMQLSAMPLAVEWQRVPWYLDARVVLPAVNASFAVIACTVLLWPVAAFVRRRRGARFGSTARDKSEHCWVRLVLVLDMLVLAGAIGLGGVAMDLTRFNPALDGPLTVLYAAAWLSVLAVPAVAWIAFRFWRDGVGSRWTRIHQTLIAVSTLIFAWFCITWGIAGTTLIY